MNNILRKALGVILIIPLSLVTLMGVFFFIKSIITLDTEKLISVGAITILVLMFAKGIQLLNKD